MKLTAVSPQGVAFSSSITSMTVDTTSGQRTVLTNHAPFVGLIDFGRVFLVGDFEDGGATREIWAVSGSVHVIGDVVLLTALGFGHSETEADEIRLSLRAAATTDHDHASWLDWRLAG